jgi:hypothetical protein
VVRFALAFVLLAPLALGPALGPLTRALGGVDEHRCACGMVRGKCGCPECERLEHERLRERAPRPYPVLRAQCGDNEVMTGSLGLPPTLPATIALFLPPLRPSIAGLRKATEAPSRERDEPATPPPRRLFV